ncbi:hypothetical protein SLEP1_g35174 [Rubroshorea leprosula]|uniref:Uncharacterized protein n=1 Tax=Rubroshorea leprosula TaxID=152421 RepID=A0AAV5KME9_9ROSI|nr:hypothetical protein SLEP1_g35174 [Rubroshorea leprosula]
MKVLLPHIQLALTAPLFANKPLWAEFKRVLPVSWIPTNCPDINKESGLCWNLITTYGTVFT